MAQYQSDSFVGMSSLPTNSHGGMLMAHRCVVHFAVSTALAANDLLVLGRLPAGYTVEEIKADAAAAGLVLDVVAKPSLEGTDGDLALSSAVTLAAGEVAGPRTVAAINFEGSNTELFLVAKVTTGATMAAGSKVGVTFTYRYRQPTY